MVDHGDYFVINRTRQYGKTTTLRMLQKYLQQEFANEFIRKAQPEQEHRRLNPEAVQNLTTRQAKEENFFDLTGLFEVLSVICGTSEKHLILMIDEADLASNNQVFLDFLGQLREYYLNREDPHEHGHTSNGRKAL